MPTRYKLINAALALSFLAGILTVCLPNCIIYYLKPYATASLSLAWTMYTKPIFIVQGPGFVLLVGAGFPLLIIRIKKYWAKVILLLVALLVTGITVWAFWLFAALNVMVPTVAGPAMYTAAIETALLLFALILIIADRIKLKATLQ